MVASLGPREWTVLQGDAGQVIDQGVGRDLDACVRVVKEPAQWKLSSDWSALGVGSRDYDRLVPGSLEVIREITIYGRRRAGSAMRLDAQPRAARRWRLRR